MAANRILFVPGHWDMESPIMMERLKEVQRLWWGQGIRPYDWIIVSGGITRKRQLIPEGEFMKNWLVRNGGIAPGKIITECHSRDSFENVRNVVDGYLCEPASLAENAEVTIVSQQQHASRLRVTFEAYGIQVVIAPVPGYSVFQHLLEWGRFYYTLYDPKGESWYSRWKVARIQRTLEGF